MRSIFMVLAMGACAWSLSACIPFAVPLPWLPTDPHKEIKKKFDEGLLSQAELIDYMGEPWAALDSRIFVYIKSKPSSFVIYGVAAYGGGAGDAAPMTTKDFVLAVDFDDHGIARNYESYADSLLHDHCFNNGVCLTRPTLNVPLLPPRFDQASKKFEAKPGQCAVYVFRGRSDEFRTENDYVGIAVSQEGSDWPLVRGVSVEGGYSHWNLPAGWVYVVKMDYLSPRNYPFDTLTRISNRTSAPVKFDCGPEELVFIRFVLPASKRIATTLQSVPMEEAMMEIDKLDRLMDLY